MRIGFRGWLAALVLFIIALFTIVAVFWLFGYPEYGSLTTGVLISGAGAGLAILAERTQNAYDRKTRLEQVKKVVIQELRRNHCFVEKKPTNLVSLRGWDLVRNIADVLNDEQIGTLLQCYTGLEFYDYDILSGGIKPGKRERAKEFIKHALSALESTIPTEGECKGILEPFQDKGTD